MVNKQPANSGDRRDTGSVPVLGRSPGGGNDNPLQYSSLENPMDRGAWQVTVHRVTRSQTCLKRLSMHAHMKLLNSNNHIDHSLLVLHFSFPYSDVSKTDLNLSTVILSLNVLKGLIA